MRVISFAIVSGLGFLLLLSLVVSPVLSGAGVRVSEVIGIRGGTADVINYLVQALVEFIVFAAIFKFMPDAHVEWNEVAVGAVVTTVLFLLGRIAMQFYRHIIVSGDIAIACYDLSRYLNGMTT